ncbi:unnamed protein product [Callosobruchus maculatus]|nr:unnamed protein product [Callosobruchus maculatus]
MPQKRCRTCLAPIQNKKYCVLSPNINSKMPASIEHLFGSTYSRPLIEVLQFCVPEMTIEMNPVPVCCYNCYNSMWIYYFFKQRCIYQEKTLMEVYRGRYGNVVGCRACPSNDHKNVVLLNGNYELEILLTSMFGNDGPSTSIPLQLCPRCIPILKDIQEFTTICLRTQDIFKQLGSDPQHSQAVVEEPTVPINK